LSREKTTLDFQRASTVSMARVLPRRRTRRRRAKVFPRASRTARFFFSSKKKGGSVVRGAPAPRRSQTVRLRTDPRRDVWGVSRDDALGGRASSADLGGVLRVDLSVFVRVERLGALPRFGSVRFRRVPRHRRRRGGRSEDTRMTGRGVNEEGGRPERRARARGKGDVPSRWRWRRRG